MEEQRKSILVFVDMIIEKGNSIVLIKHKVGWFKDKWGLPGGHVEAGEIAEHAAVREANEETSLDIRLKQILGVYSDPNRDRRGPSLTTVFVADYLSGELKGGDDAAEAKWIDASRIPFGELAGDHPKILKDYLKWKEKGGTYWSTKD